MDKISKRARAQAIIIRKKKILFEYGESGDVTWRFLIGGGILKGESPQKAVIREVKEETGANGKIIFELAEEISESHYTFLVDIGDQKCILGLDPEYENNPEKQHLQKLVWIPLSEKTNFSDKEILYLTKLKEDCINRQYQDEWVEALFSLLS